MSAKVKLVPDLVVPMSEHRTFKYFKEETLQKYAEQYGWTLIDDSNRKDMFMDMIRQMDMSYSYKPVLMKASHDSMPTIKGRIKLEDIVAYFRILLRGASRTAGVKVEKAKQHLRQGRLYRKGSRAEHSLQPLQTLRGYADAPPHQRRWASCRWMKPCGSDLSKEEKAEIEKICDARS
jgi:hypothetical protein